MKVKWISGNGLCLIEYTEEEGKLSVEEFKHKLMQFVSENFYGCIFTHIGGAGKGKTLIQLQDTRRR